MMIAFLTILSLSHTLCSVSAHEVFTGVRFAQDQLAWRVLLLFDNRNGVASRPAIFVDLLGLWKSRRKSSIGTDAEPDVGLR